MSDSQYLSKNAMKHFKLDNQPFKSTGAISDIYNDSIISAYVNEAFRKVISTDNLFIIDGEKGQGKTSLGKLLYSVGAKNKKLCNFRILDCSPVTTAINFLTLLRDTKGDTINEKNVSLQELTTNTAKNVFIMMNKKRVPVVILDNSSKLQKKVLIEIIKFSNSFYEYFPNSVKLVLIGDVNDITNKLRGQKFKLVQQNKYILFTPPKIQKNQIESYLKFKFNTTDSGSLIRTIITNLSPSVLKETKGNYLAFNLAICRCIEEMVFDAEENQRFRKNKLIQIGKVIAALALLITALIALITGKILD